MNAPEIDRYRSGEAELPRHPPSAPMQDLQSAKHFLVHITRRWPEVYVGTQLEVKGPAQ